MKRTLCLGLALFVVAACDETTTLADGGADAGTDAGQDVDGGVADAGMESCEATFVWWQKDAYLEEPGRGSAFWPPHTTTSLTVTCTPPDASPEVIAEAEMINHGTSVADVDVAGTQILDAMRTETASGTRSDLLALVARYESCECATMFLSLDALSDTAAMDLVAELSTYLSANMTCPASAGGVAQLVSDLMAGNIAEVLALAPMCSFSAGGWETGLKEAFTVVVSAASEILDDYHVCNNDALLQAGLWDQFASTGVVGTCDTAASFCSGPAWFMPCDETDRSACVPPSP